MVKNAQKVIAIEGCFIKCASRMMKGVILELNPEIVIADGLYDFDKKLFGINEMSSEEISIHAETVADKVIDLFNNN